MLCRFSTRFKNGAELLIGNLLNYSKIQNLKLMIYLNEIKKIS